jgi:L-iditol 2-dehydrogenase
MKSLVLHAPKNLTYEPDWSEPDIPEGWTCVKVRASGICGSDLPRIMQTGAYHHPMVPGHEFSGEVVSSSTPGVKTGQRVAVLPIIPCGQCAGCQVGPFHCTHYDFIGSRRDGGFAEYVAVPPQNLFHLPDDLSYEDGAFIEPVAVTLHVMRRAGLTPGARVLVFGGGAIGILTAQWASILGAAQVVLADLRDESLAVASACKIEHTLNPLSDAFKALDSFDFIFEAAGATAALLSGIEKAAPRATLTVVGREVKDTVIPLAAFERLMRKELTLKGCWGYDLGADTGLVYETLAQGKLTFSPMITQRLDLQDGPQTVAGMWNKSFFFCKAMFVL